MACSVLPNRTRLITPTNDSSQPRPPLSFITQIRCSHHQNPENNTIHRPPRFKTHLLKPVIGPPNRFPPPRIDHIKKISAEDEDDEDRGEEKMGSLQKGIQEMLVLCGFGYFVQGFRGFPWLGLNFHMAHNLHFNPSTLQLVQTAAILPMVIKPLYGVLSDALYIAGGHRIPYVCIGVVLQVLSWGSLALIPVAGEGLPTLMACVLLSNLGASITEVAKDALVAEYGQSHKLTGLQSYAFMALAAGGILGNLIGGFFLLKTQQPRSMFLLFTALLSLQLAISMATREDSLGLPKASSKNLAEKPVSEIIRKQYSNLITALREENISGPLIWIVASIAIVPILSGSSFCYQTQFLNLDPSIIGMSRVTSQLMLLSTVVIYDRFWKRISIRKLIGITQILYACSLLLDLVLVKQINLQFGIPNELFALCFAGVAETIAQFKVLPMLVLFGSLAPPGCEGSLTSFVASALCLASIVSGFFGVGLASVLGITSGDYSSFPLGIVIQFVAALVPLRWIYNLPSSQPTGVKEKKRGMSKRNRRNRRIGRVIFGSLYAYRRERESKGQ